jgi:lysophospholipase L1-like esterase
LRRGFHIVLRGVYTILVALLLAEVVLRVASGAVSQRSVSDGAGGSRTLLAVGDSHTYGVFFEAEESYPGRLESLLAERAPGRYRVVNVGLPGTNSSEVVTRLAGWLAQYRPTTVILCIGMNNGWNRSNTTEAGARGRINQLLDKLRIVRLIRVARSNVGAQAPEAYAGRPEIERVVIGEGAVAVEHRDAETGEVLIRHTGSFFDLLPLSEQREILRRDLAEILALCHDWGVELVLLDYAVYPISGKLEPSQQTLLAVNEEARAFAAQHDIAFVDVSSHFDSLMRRGISAQQLFHPDKGHPSRRGYRQIAQLVADAIDP